jgi:elongation factor G
MDKADARVRSTLEMLQPASSVPRPPHPDRQSGGVTGFTDLALERAFVYREHAASETIDMGDEEPARRKPASPCSRRWPTMMTA